MVQSEYETRVDAVLTKYYLHIIYRAKMVYCEETFYLYHDILMWQKQPTHALLKKMIETYIKPNSMYETGTISPSVRQRMIEGDVHAFTEAKMELLREIRANPVLDTILFPVMEPNPSIRMGRFCRCM
jgi:hypothetical protein